jgi:hypothetical protein
MFVTMDREQDTWGRVWLHTKMDRISMPFLLQLKTNPAKTIQYDRILYA